MTKKNKEQVFVTVCLPEDSILERMTSSALTSVSAQLTEEKNKYFESYRSRQDKIHKLLEKAQKAEQEDRIAKDPDYWKKHQGVGGPSRTSPRFGTKIEG